VVSSGSKYSLEAGSCEHEMNLRDPWRKISKLTKHSIGFARRILLHGVLTAHIIECPTSEEDNTERARIWKDTVVYCF
jgi:hypothetical protein